MTRAAREQLEAQAIAFAFRLADQVLLPWLTRLISQGIDAPAAMSDAAKVVAGLDRDHPDWPGAQKREFAVEAIRILLRNRNGREPDARDVDLALQLAVAELPVPQPRPPAATE